MSAGPSPSIFSKYLIGVRKVYLPNEPGPATSQFSSISSNNFPLYGAVRSLAFRGVDAQRVR